MVVDADIWSEVAAMVALGADDLPVVRGLSVLPNGTWRACQARPNESFQVRPARSCSAFDFPLPPRSTVSTPSNYFVIPRFTHIMDSFGAGGLSAFSNSDPKTQIMRQIQQEAAMQNARMLVEVRPRLQILIERVVDG